MAQTKVAWQKSDKNMQECVKKFIFDRFCEKYTCTHKYYEGLFPCTICGDKFGLESSLELHMNRSSVLITHFCETCDKILKFTNKCSVLSHVFSHITSALTLDLGYFKIEHVPLKLFKDKNMKKDELDVRPLDNSEVVNKELNEKLLSIAKNNNVSISSSISSVPKKLIVVENVISELNSTPLKCIRCYVPNCHKICFYEDIENHIVTHHTKICHKCLKCNIIFYLENKTKQHMQSVHGSKDYSYKVFQCGMCGRNVDEKDFKSHHEEHLPNFTKTEYFYYCYSCGIFLQHKDEYESHISNCNSHLKKKASSSSEKSKVQILTDDSYKSLLKPIYVKKIENNKFNDMCNSNIKKLNFSHTNSVPAVKQNDTDKQKTMIKIKNSHILDKILFKNNNKKVKVTPRKVPKVIPAEKLPENILQEPKTISDNECPICNKKFESDFDLKIHMRNHGMAFLKKSKNAHISVTP